MIKAEDLRIGNWVYETRLIGINAIVKIDSIFNDETPLVNISANGDIDAEWLIEGTSLDDIEPIPLSPAILEKCGFKRINGIGQTGCFILKPLKINIEDNCVLVSIKIVPHPRFQRLREIQYLHQLQNLYYALCRTELNAKL